MTFEDHGVVAGCWTGVLRADNCPAGLQVVQGGRAVATPQVRQDGPGAWRVSAELPGSVIDGGAHSLLLVAGDPGMPASQVLARLTLVAGTVAGEDLLAEVAQLRAELDLLKREFRRFAAGT